MAATAGTGADADGAPRLQAVAAHSLPAAIGVATSMAAARATDGASESIDPGMRQLAAMATRASTSQRHFGATVRGYVVGWASGCAVTPRSRNTVRAACSPHIPWTPPPGGVAAEQRYTCGTAVRYGFHRTVGRKSVWRTVGEPALMSPPTKLGL